MAGALRLRGEGTCGCGSGELARASRGRRGVVAPMGCLEFLPSSAFARPRSGRSGQACVCLDVLLARARAAGGENKPQMLDKSPAMRSRFAMPRPSPSPLPGPFPGLTPPTLLEVHACRPDRASLIPSSAPARSPAIKKVKTPSTACPGAAVLVCRPRSQARAAVAVESGETMRRVGGDHAAREKCRLRDPLATQRRSGTLGT
jgi:hypothetical protein